MDIAKENENRRLHDVEKWKSGTIVAELGVHADVVERVLDPGASSSRSSSSSAANATPGTSPRERRRRPSER